jgi:signal transduction histidine kinase
VKAQLEEVRASRERIVRTADEERRRVERNLHDGAQQRLVSLSLALTMAQAQMKSASPEAAATLEQAEAELKLAIGELRELARGIHPAILGEAGLKPALEALAERSSVPVQLRADVDGRLSPLVEATAYFVAAEALTNVAKYASASSVELSAVQKDGWLQLMIRDDGVGGADPSEGSGLRGLVDRVAAVGGRLSIDSLSGRGTRLVAEIPCG